MPRDWLAIRQARPDISDYLLHWTHGRSEDGTWLKPFDVLEEILQCGYLKPTFAPKRSVTAGAANNTIHGPQPAVCFSEQPLDAFLKSVEVLPGRCKPYAVAVHKWHLFNYGGRPVIYGDDSALWRLHEDDKYLWARYSPIPNKTFGGYPLDWTHEREWRTKQHIHQYPGIGKTPPEGIPLLLPPAEYPGSKKPVLALPRILVKTVDERDRLREWINSLPAHKGGNGVIQYYFKILPRVMVIPLDYVQERVAAGDIRYARLETLPYEELDPSFDTRTPEKYL